MGLWYPKGSGFELTAFSDVDHAGCVDTRKSTSGGTQFLGDKLVSWMSKKQDCTAMSSAEAEYVALSASCAQVMWMRTQLQDYGFNYNKIPLYCDSQSAIAISCNPVQHSRTKHIHTRYHFIKEQSALPEERFQYLVRRIGMRCLTPAELEGRMPTKIEITLEQSQQGVSNDCLEHSECYSLVFTMDDEILPVSIIKQHAVRIHKDGDSDASFQDIKSIKGDCLQEFKDDAKYEHVGQDTRSQGGKDDQDGRIKI
ncbi:hypothetical protein Tco_1101915 [Tanacetum coccineum]